MKTSCRIPPTPCLRNSKSVSQPTPTSAWARARRTIKANQGESSPIKAKRWRLLREMCADIVELRKGDHTAERLQIERERLELEKEKTEKRVREKVEKLQKQLAKKRKGGIPRKLLRQIERAANIIS